MSQINASGKPYGTGDPLYQKPYIDTDEWRDKPVRHRYIHGGFEDTECRFSFYLPPAEQYEGRFFQMVLPHSGVETAGITPLHATMLSDPIPFTLDSGAYLVESNQGRMASYPYEDSTINGYRASAATAEYSRVMAARIYGEHRHYGYVFGGSGGAYRTFSCFENCPGTWDGAVPFVPPSPMSLPYMFTVQAHALRLLRDKLSYIIDAVDPGGSGDMYRGLNVEEREALAEVTRMGFPQKAWFSLEGVAPTYMGMLSIFLDNMQKWDPGYFHDFWNVPGYLGHKPPRSLSQARVKHRTKIKKVLNVREASGMGLAVSTSARMADSRGEVPGAVELEELPEGNLNGNTMTLTSGAAAGNTLYISSVTGDLLILGFGEENARGLEKMQAGDEVLIDNGTILAIQTYHRHQIPSPDYYVWDQFRAAGQQVYPQRAELLGPRYVKHSNGTIQSGRFEGKMIVVASAMDEIAFPWHADWYHQRAKEALGPRLEDNFRLWYVEHGMHSAPAIKPGGRRPVATSRIVDYRGVLQQALRCMSNWVEKGIPPVASTVYDVADGQIILRPTAAQRNGMQPVVTMKANGGMRAEVSVGETVEFTAVIEVPENAGRIAGAKWDFEASGEYQVVEQFEDYDRAPSSVTLKAAYTYTEPGIYFPAILAMSQRQEDFGTPFCQADNLARVRVVVR
ncbi:hypothetical protein ACFLW2_00010 [Chloroflexota bacterium]